MQAQLTALFCALAARVALALAAAAHDRAVHIAEGVFHRLKGKADAPLVAGRTDALCWSPAFWLSAALCVVAEMGLAAAVLLGGAIALPLLAASGALLDVPLLPVPFLSSALLDAGAGTAAEGLKPPKGFDEAVIFFDDFCLG